MTKQPVVCYIGRFGKPKDAPSIRVYNNLKIFNHLNYRCECICFKDDDNASFESNFCHYNFIPPKIANTTFDKLSNLCELIFVFNGYKRLKSYLESIKPDIIILYNDLFTLSVKLLTYCRKRNIKLMADVTEWYDSNNRKNNIADYIVPFLTDKRIRYIDQKINNVITISPYLADYYTKRGCNVFKLPPVFEIKSDIEITKYNYYANHVVNFIYAGSMGNKDILQPFIEAIGIINKDVIKIRFDVIGMTLEEYSRLHDINDVNGVFFHGRLPNNKVLDFLSRADFSVLLRHNRRYARAGFSTKFAEAMSHGVAMFCNEVGGAETTITHFKDGVVIKDVSEEEIKNALSSIIELSENELMQLRRNTYATGRKLFSLENYVEQMKTYLEEL